MHRAAGKQALDHSHLQRATGPKPPTGAKRKLEQTKKRLHSAGHGQRSRKRQRQPPSSSGDPSTKHLSQPTQTLAVRALRTLAKEYKQPVTVHCGSATRYRSVCKLAVRQERGATVIGLFAPGSHEVAPGSATSPTQTKGLNRGVTAVEGAIKATSTPVYVNGEAKGTGSLSYVCLMEELTSGRCQLTLVRPPELTGCCSSPPLRYGTARPRLHILGSWWSISRRIVRAAFTRSTTTATLSLDMTMLFSGGKALLGRWLGQPAPKVSPKRVRVCVTCSAQLHHLRVLSPSTSHR